MKEKLNFFNIKICSIAFALVLILTIPAYAATEPIEIKVNSPSQVIPGTVLHIQVSIINSQIEEISTPQATPQVQQSQNINIAEQTSIIKDEKKVTINEISYDNPFQLTEKTTVSQQVSTISSNSKPKQEKKSVNKKLSPIGNALKQREELNTEFNNRIKTEKLSDEEIKSYIKSEDDLKTKISDGIDLIYIDVPVPKDFPEGTALTIPVNVAYSTTSASTQTFSTIISLNVTSNPVPKRAIIIDIDGMKRDALYNSLNAMPNMSEIANNGVRFTDATTVFPSITLAAQASIFTGNYPKNHKIAGNSWFDRSTAEWRKYGLWTYLGDGEQNSDLSTNVDTIYEAAKRDRNIDSTVIFNQFSRGSTQWITPGASEYEANYISHDFPKIDSNAMERALFQLYYNADRKITTIYLPGLDGYSHWLGPNGVDPYNQEYYLIHNVDGQIGRLINGGCALQNLLGVCSIEYPGLKNNGLMIETVIVIVSDHGQTPVKIAPEFRITKDILEQKLLSAGYDIDDHGLLEGGYNAVAASNGGMGQIYIGNISTNDWNTMGYSDLQPALVAFKSEPYVDVVLFRLTSGYLVYTGGMGAGMESLETFFAGKADYVDAVNRIKSLDSERSGDIILLAKASDGYYFDDPAAFPTPDQLLLGEHGGLNPDESYIPLIFSGPTIRKGETDPTPARSIDMAKTLADLLGFSMSKSDGKVLPGLRHISSIKVTSPNGSENWVRGGTRTIRWNYTGDPGAYVMIELLKGGVLNRTINSSTSIGSSGSGSYTWLINSTQALGTDYKIRVTSTANPAYNDTSDKDFTISDLTPKTGDINGDGKLTLVDAIYLAKHVGSFSGYE
ncbi:MAG: alkaline phosphatase family protein, partial [Methanococcaceae archaeon]